MKIIKNVFFLVAVLMAFTACEGDQGEPGPAGEKGDQGEQGPKGDPGDNTGGLTQNGFIKGTITGTQSDGTTPINVNFEFTYQEDSFEGRRRVEDEVYSIEIVRNALPIVDNGDFFFFDFNYDFQNNTLVRLNDIGVSVFSELPNNQLLEFDFDYGTSSSGPQIEMTVTNMEFNVDTGLMTFNYSISIPGSFNDSGNDATIAGSVEVNLFSEIVIRRG